MLQIQLDNVSKKFILHWVVKNISFSFQAPKKYALTGRNGSGKSTLLKVMAGMTPPNKGSVDYTLNGYPIKPSEWHHHLAFTAPYLDLFEDLNYNELLDFYLRALNLQPEKKDLLWLDLQLPTKTNRQIKFYSSGMKQKLKLGLCFLKPSAVYFLDEPTANLDKKNIEWYYHKIQEKKSALIIIASNDPEEYHFVDEIVNLDKF